MTDYSALTDSELLENWDMESSFIQRDKLLQTMRERHLFPGDFQSEWETTSGAYPTMDDPNFIQKLLERREFAESYQPTAEESEGDPCLERRAEGFQLSPVQRFVANFMSPRTPFNSMLLYHGVGVGKTCSAVQIAEQWLNFYPNRRVIILAPPTIKSGIETNIFDIEKVKLGANENEPNTSEQCTGTIYMELTNTLYERNRETILRKVRRKINQRYLITGYLSFAYKLREIFSDIPERFTGEDRVAIEVRELQKNFDGTLLIIDEAHNLRDNPEESAQAAVDVEDAESDAKHSDEKAGKILTPYLRQLLKVVNGMKLVLMTATPMYNSYREIIHMMNLILLNEKMGEINEPQIFNPDGTFRDGGLEILGGIARRYVSYMRGENPDIFPLRLNPSGTLTAAAYPTHNPREFPLNSKERSYVNYLPIVPVEIKGDLLAVQQQMMDGLQEGRGGDEISVFQLVSIIEAGICIVPPVTEEQAEEENTSPVFELQDRVSKNALALHFYRQTVGGEIVFKARGLGRASWLAEEQLPLWAPKVAKILSSVKTSAGVCFIYSRFVSMGAQPIALALEANGYTLYGRNMPLLSDGPQSPGGRQCALCPLREHNHSNADHEFAPAYYVLLTGDGKLSPDNRGQIAVARGDANKDGRQIKVIVGSSVTAEGVDLRFIREIHIMESWYHLNKLEQVIGRGIRTFSHCLLPIEQRNCTVYMYANVMPADNPRETVDLYSYRKAYKKARQIGAVSRVLKTFAVDCNLNHDSIIIKDREPRTIMNSQGQILEDVSVDDRPHTAICDWLDSCDYECIPKVKVEPDDASEVSYDIFTARWHQAEMKRVVRSLFSYGNNVAIPEEAMATLLGKYPRIARLELLSNIINNKSFIVVNNGREGYIIYKNGLYLFQPFAYDDQRIPRAVRMASYPVRQDSYSPALLSLIGPEVDVAPTNEAVVAAPVTVKAIDPIKLLTVVSSWQQWARALATADTIMPAAIVDWFDEQLEGDKKDLDRRLNRLLMIRWISQSFREADIDADTIERLFLEYLFDEEMTADERYAFFQNKELQDIGHKLSPSQLYDMKANKNYVYMYVSTEDGLLKYICDATTGSECAPALQDLINETYPLNEFIVSTANTGFLYGILAPNKNGYIVFKTTEPPIAGSAAALQRKLKTGAECQIISKTSHLVRKAVLLGERLTAGGHSNLGFTDEVLDQSARKIKNTQQICTVTNLVLRYMDIIRFEKKKWFFRPVDAFMTGHRVSIKPAVK